MLLSFWVKTVILKTRMALCMTYSPEFNPSIQMSDIGIDDLRIENIHDG